MEKLVSTSSKHLKLLTDFTLHKEAHEHIAQGYLTNSKRPECHVMGVYPTHLKSGQGCYVVDYRGKKYIDFITALGTNLLGYGHEQVNQAAISAISQGQLLSFAGTQEIRTAKKLKELFMFVDCWKFVKTGNEACLAALRIARAYKKGSGLILCQGFHGHGDEFSSLLPASPGVMRHEHIKTLLDDYVEEDIGEADAVIIEPVITDASEKRRKWLYKLREVCSKYGTLLIFDEIVTGFRWPRFSVSRYWGIDPDLIVIGKAMANGFSLAAVGGKYHVMNSDDYFVSSTYASSSEALAACEKVCELLMRNYHIDDLWIKGQRFISEFNKLWPEKIFIEGYPTRGIFKGDDKIKALFFQEACLAGILLGPSFFFNFPLMAMSDHCLASFRDIFYRIRSGEVKLLGEMPKKAISEKARRT